MDAEFFSIQQALISVSNKNKIETLAYHLQKHKIPILSSDGTAKYLNSHNINTIEISEYTNQQELLSGRVKTLHPRVHAGILARKNNTLDQADLKKFNILPINLIIVNLYPFIEFIKNKENRNITNKLDCLDYIDIGGQTLIRSAAKNYQDTIIIVDPLDYDWLINKLIHQLAITEAERFELATKAFSHTAQYEQAIAETFSQLQHNTNKLDSQFCQTSPDGILTTLPKTLNLNLQQIGELRYGENPDQQAGIYSIDNNDEQIHKNISNNLIQGKELSYNNIVDSDCAINIIKSLKSLHDNLTHCVIIKHAIPCGVASYVDTQNSHSAYQAYQKAYHADARSAFGGIIAINNTIDAKLADTIITQQFLEVLIAQNFTVDAKEIISSKPNIRLIKYDFNNYVLSAHDDATLTNIPRLINNLSFKSIDNGILIQTKMLTDCLDNNNNFNIVTTTKDIPEQILQNLKFSWYIAQHVKSNAIVIANNLQTIGIGSGQTSRIGSIEIALQLAQMNNHDTNDSVMASDGFFPFADSIEIAHQYGIRAIIQPGGSKNDSKIITKANQLNIVMVLTNKRKFCH